MINSLKVWLVASAGTLGKNAGDPVVTKSISSYVTYLNKAAQNVVGSPIGSSIPPSYRPLFIKKDYLAMVEAFICNEDWLYALSIAEIILKYEELGVMYHKANNTPRTDKGYKGLVNSSSALRGLIFYLKSSQIWVDKTGWMPNSRLNLASIRSMIRKPDIHKIDGNECLINTTNLDFIKLAIENSFFFDPTCAVARHADIVDCIAKSQELPARWSSEANAYNLPVTTKKQAVNTLGLIYKGRYPVVIDGNDNAQVKSQISQYTGYTVSGGVDSIFQNYKISHIWGNASDPRYFTNLWNIALIPAWANDLMDKDEYAPGASNLVILLKSTFKAICMKHYGMKGKAAINYDFSIFSIHPNHLAKVKHGEYQINVIGSRQNGQKLSNISKSIIKV